MTATAVEPKTFAREFRFAKETENTLQFKEVVPKGEPKISGTLYVQKHATFDMGDMEGITLDVLITIKPS